MGLGRDTRHCSEGGCRSQVRMATEEEFTEAGSSSEELSLPVRGDPNPSHPVGRDSWYPVAGQGKNQAYRADVGNFPDIPVCVWFSVLGLGLWAWG